MSCSRRDFLRTLFGTSALVSFGPTLPVFLGRAAGAASEQPSSPGTVLVVIQLSGGNDGLNTVVPFEDDHYGRARPTLRLPVDKLHKIKPMLGPWQPVCAV